MTTPSVRQILETTSASLVCGVVCIVFALADAAILSGNGLPHLFPVAVSITLISVVVLAPIVGYLSSMRYCIAGAQEVTAVVLATMVASISATLASTGASIEIQLVTAIACLLIATIAVGVTCYLAGVFRLGRFIRYVPYPVIAGFLAGASILLVKFSIEMSVGMQLQLTELNSLASASNLGKLALTVVICLALFALAPKMATGTLIVLLIALSIPGFFLLVYVTGSPIEFWITGNWTLINTSTKNVLPVIGPSDFNKVDWQVVASQIPQMASLALITLITALIKINTLESIARREVDQDSELKALGIGNVASGFAGGILGFHTLSVTEIARRMQAPTRIVGVGTSIVCLFALFFSGEFLTFLPRFLFSGIIMWISIDLFISFFLVPIRQIPRLDSVILASVMLSIVFWGFLPAVMLGLLSATIIFVLEYSKINVIRSEYTGTDIRSNVDRSVDVAEHLRLVGSELKVFRLQGYMFFGTAYRLIEDMKKSMQGDETKFLLIDFKKITGIDSSANLMLPRILSYCQDRNILLLLADAPQHVISAIEKDAADLNTSESSKIESDQYRQFPDMDSALEFYEAQQLLKAPNDLTAPETTTLADWLVGTTSNRDISRFTEFFTEQDLHEGEILIEEGNQAGTLYLVLSGSFDVVAGMGNHPDIRVRKVGPGSLLGEISLYTASHATANVVASEPSRVASIGKDDTEIMFSECPEYAAVFHRKIATELANRLADSVRVIGLHASA